MLKPSPPTARERKRYLLVNVETTETVSAKDVENVIINALLQFLGELGTSRASTLVLQETWNGKSLIIKCAHNMVDEVKAALLLVKNIGDSPARLSVIKVSGSIAKLKSYQRKI